MSAAPDVTVVMPIHNAERWLPAALASLWAQTGVSLEVVAIDDGSTDAGAAILQRAASAGRPLTILRNERNEGIVSALNRGLDEARGRYIARMDADDLCMPERLSRQIAFLEQTGYDLCGTWFVEFGGGLPRTVRWPHTEAAVRTAMLFQNTLCHPTVLARRAVFDLHRYRGDYALAEDYDLFARAGAEFRLANVPQALLRYRRHAQQATQARRDAMEQVTRRIRRDLLRQHVPEVSPEEERLHNLIRAPSSIRSAADLHGIESWLLDLVRRSNHPDARAVVASQWLRACIRAAPLGSLMWTTFAKSPLSRGPHGRLAARIDLAALALTRLDYRSAPFQFLRRLGLSA